MIDCGASRMMLGIFRQAGGRVHLESSFVERFLEIEPDREKWLERSAEGFRELRNRARRGGPCVLVLPGHLVLTKFLTVPRVTPEQRRKVIHFESEQNLPVALSELVWDSVVSGERASGLEVMLAASHLKRVDALCRAARAAGFEPRRVLPGALALLAAFREVCPEALAPVVVMNLGARSTTLLFVEKGRFLTRTFAGGLNPSGASKSMAEVGEVAAVASQELLRSIRHYQRQSAFGEPVRLYLTGGGARVPGLAGALGARLPFPLEILDAKQGLGGRPAPTETNQETSIELLGAAIAEAREDATIVNLLPSRFVRHAQTRRRRMVAMAAGCAAALVGAVLWSMRPAVQRPSPGIRTAALAAMAPVIGTPVAAPDQNAVHEEPAEPAAENTPSLALELVAVRSEPFRVQLAGCVGGPDDYRAILMAPSQQETLVAASGSRFEALGVQVRNVELRKVAVNHGDFWPVFEVAAFATVHDERTGEEVVLDSRRPKMGPLQAWLRRPDDKGVSRRLREGDDLDDAGVTYRIDRIQADPPEIVVLREVDGEWEPEGTVLRPAASARRVATENPARVASSRDGGLP